MKPAEDNTNTTTEIADGKNIAIIAYITVIGLIIAFVMNSDKKQPFATYHIRQSLGVMLTAFAGAFINIIPFLGWLLYLPILVIIVVMWISGLMNAINGKEKPILILGKKYEQWFKSL